MSACDRHNASFSGIESDGGNVRGSITLPLPITLSNRIGRLCGHQIVERDHPVRQILSERADVADGEHIGRKLPSETRMVECANMAASDQGLRVDPSQRLNRFGAAP